MVPSDLFKLACNIKKLIVWCISAKKNYYNITKNSRKFQASVTILECFSKIFQNCEKGESFTAHELLRKRF